MQKLYAILGIIIAFIIIYILQSNFFNWFTIASISPNLFILLVLFIGLFAGRIPGFLSGVTIGLVLDFLLGRTIGVSAIMLGIVGIVGSHFDKNFSKESRLTIMLMVIGATIIYELGCYLLNVWMLEMPLELDAFLKITIIEVIYNTIITIILYPIIQKLGYIIENVFKQKNILTRYF